MGSETDLGVLPDEIRESARLSSGEVEWPKDIAEAAIKALADAGFVIVGLDVRSYVDGTREVPMSSCDPDPNLSPDANAARGKEAALEAFSDIDFYAPTNPDGDADIWVIVTWLDAGV